MISISRFCSGWPLAVLLTLGCAPAQALDYQVHGFAAQGYTLTEGNNVDGDSSDHGSLDYYELGLNGTVSITPDLLVSAQTLLRRAGSTDTDGLRLDFAQIDYRFLAARDYNAGIRLGRVKNPYGFYNDTRDVVFTRPGIMLPNSVYFDNDGLRSVFFSRDGAQLYGGAQLGDHYLTLETNRALNSNLSSKDQQDLLAGQQLPIRLQVRNFDAERLQDEWNGGTVKLALSHLHAGLLIQPDQGVPFNGGLYDNLWVLSARYNARLFALTGEYLVDFAKTNGDLTGSSSNSGDGFYLQGDYQLLPHWSAMGRYSATFANRHDRDGREYTAQTGGDRYSQFSHDEALGLNWRPTEHWGAWAEFHVIQGTADVPAADNIGNRPHDHWNMFQLMGAYRF